MATGEVRSREARRRRITERGSDRLALITGTIQTLPPHADEPSPSPDPRQHEDIAIQPPLPIQDSDKEVSQQHLLHEKVEPSRCNSDKGRRNASRAASLLGIDKELPLVSSSTLSRAASLLGMEKEFSQVSSSIQSDVLNHHDEQQSHRTSLTTGQKCSAIAASENIRMCCSVAAAIAVTLSYIEFPILGWTWRLIRRSILLRPVYVLLLTNISVVLTWLLLGTKNHKFKMRQKSIVPTFGGRGLADQLGKALDILLLLQNIFGALFNDFSIYAAVLVCSLSLV